MPKTRSRCKIQKRSRKGGFFGKPNENKTYYNNKKDFDRYWKGLEGMPTEWGFGAPMSFTYWPGISNRDMKPIPGYFEKGNDRYDRYMNSKYANDSNYSRSGQDNRLFGIF